MKGSRSTNYQYKNGDRKSSKREKAQKLDRKSSRGMIFENEELRLRTININAEVERGQTDIKRLRRENEHLRREIWTLRDECDRLNKRFKAKILDQDHGVCNARGSGGSSGCTRCPSQSNSDDSDSCDTCKGDDGHCSDDCCQMSNVKQNAAMDCAKPNNNINASYPKFNEPQHLHNTFDHLSVVSEETLSNSEVQAAAHSQSDKHNQLYQQEATKLPTLMGQLTPLTPIELVANQLNDLQAVVPPLSYFENILHEHMGSTIGMTPDTACITPNSKIVKHTNGWDYNLQSPFAHRKPSITSSTSSPSSGSARSPSLKQRYMPPQTTLTTFVPTPLTPTPTPPPMISDSAIEKSANNAPNESSKSTPKIETVAITTMPTTALPPQLTIGSPKHFFSPLKPRLKINTSLANKNATIPTPPIVPTPAIDTSKIESSTTTPNEHQNCDPPDIYVANALASPYKRQPLPSQSPQLPQRNTHSSGTLNVSPRLCQHQHCPHQHQHQHEHQHQRQRQHQHHYQHQYQHNILKPKHQKDTETILSMSPVLVVDVVDNDFDVTIDADAGAGACTGAGAGAGAGADADVNVDVDANTSDGKNAATPINIEATAACTDTDTETAIVTDATDTANQSLLFPTAMLDPFPPTACFSKPNEPIYAIAQERTYNFISSSALTKPLMAATINSNSPSKISIASIKPTKTPESALNFNCGNQTESVNLETILNDIEHISEDILAIQLERNKSGDNLSNTKVAQNANQLKEEDKNKKPYRSEMNLLLSYDGKNPTITPTPITTKTVSNHSGVAGENGLRTRARSLERETTESPSPKIPDAMPVFPENRTYIGLEQLNKGTTANGLPLQKPPQHSIVVGSKSASSSPKKPAPPVPPTRLYPPSLNIRCVGIARSAPLVNEAPATPKVMNAEPTFGMQGLVPNKSHLYKALANAAAKRGQFLLTSPTLSKSFDAEQTAEEDEENDAPTEESPSQTEAANRKSRRVSIVCGGSPLTPDVSPTVTTPSTTPVHAIAASPTNQLSTGSCTNLTSTPTNPLLQNLKQITCHSTPNSPHSIRRRNDVNTHAIPLSHDDLIRGSQVQHQHQHQHSNSSNSASQYRRSSQDSTRGNVTEAATASVNPVATRSKCSRRHSDGTVASNVQRISGSSGHHHHHHHHHQHSSSTVGNAHPHHSRHSHQDSNLETGSVSDRNSNSFASSRDSSTSFSMRSQRRKISVSSHTGGKIPWCGCWGNGCL